MQVVIAVVLALSIFTIWVWIRCPVQSQRKIPRIGGSQWGWLGLAQAKIDFVKHGAAMVDEGYHKASKPTPSGFPQELNSLWETRLNAMRWESFDLSFPKGQTDLPENTFHGKSIGPYCSQLIVMCLCKPC